MSANLQRDYFNDLASRWDQLPTPPDAAERVRQFVTDATGPACRTVLDVGCGTGILIRDLLAAPGVQRVVEFDLAEGMLVRNRRAHPDSPLHYVCGDARLLPFSSGAFDLVVCFGVLPHLGDAREALRDLFDLAGPNGSLAVGHLMGSEQLNQKHASIGGPVGRHRLPSAADLARILDGLGAHVVLAREAADGYCVRAER